MRPWSSLQEKTPRGEGKGGDPRGLSFKSGAREGGNLSYKWGGGYQRGEWNQLRERPGTRREPLRSKRGRGGGGGGSLLQEERDLGAKLTREGSGQSVKLTREGCGG